MVQRLVATDIHSDAWNHTCNFPLDVHGWPQIANLRASGVLEVRYRIGCTLPGHLFVILGKVVAERGEAVDAFWLQHVHEVCESMIPGVLAELQLEAQPGYSDPEGDLHSDVADGNFLMNVVVRIRPDTKAWVDVFFPEISSLHPDVTD